jgi:hypothetical protein
LSPAGLKIVEIGRRNGMRRGSGLGLVFGAEAFALDESNVGVVQETIESAEVSTESLLKISGQCLKARLVLSSIEPRS